MIDLSNHRASKSGIDTRAKAPFGQPVLQD
jgi:hypothetical protein